MTRDQIRDIANQRLGPILRLARLMAEKDTSTIAQELGAPELDVQWVEDHPAEVPCCDLYRLLSHYGPEAQYEVNLACIKLSLQLRGRPKGDSPSPLHC